MSILTDRLDTILPEGYWNIIETWYPKYQSSNEILRSDLLTRAHEHELYNEGNVDDLMNIMEDSNHSGLTIKELSYIHDLGLYVLSLQEQIESLKSQTK
jgi:hypothetical protein